MQVDFTKAFDKQFAKLPLKRQEKARETIALYLQNVSAPSLRLHVLKGEWLGYQAISAGGDLRLHFKMVEQDTILFVAVGSHSQLYK